MPSGTFSNLCCLCTSIRNGLSHMPTACDDFVRDIVQKQPDVMLDKLCRQMAKARDIVASHDMKCRMLQALV